MEGLSPKGIRSLEKIIQSKFDRVSMDLLGLIPHKVKDKKIVFKSTKDNIISLYLNALNSRDPNALEERTLKKMLRIANGYLNALKERTTAKITNDVDSYVKNQKAQKKPVSINEIDKLIKKDLDKAGKHLKLIANAESQKATNVGTALQISKIAKERKIDDPTVFFIVTQDDVTGYYEYVLHLLPDRTTPRVWKLSEISHSYYKPGEQYPSMSGLHPNCRCKLTYLASGWGFDSKGSIKYKGPGYDEFTEQRKKHGLPNVPEKPNKKM